MESSFDDVGSFYNGLSGKSKDDFGQGSDRFITYMNVYKNTIANPDGCELVLVEDGEHQNRVEYGDILFTQSSETLEEVGLSSVWLHKASPFLNSFCFGFHFKEKGIINPRFIAYGLRTSYMREQIIREGQGATRYNLSSNRLKPIKLVYPSYQEQSKVASLMSCIEKRIEKQQELICTLKKYKRGLHKLVFIKNRKPSWEKSALHDIASFCGGGTPSKDVSSYWDGEIGWISSSDIQEEWIDDISVTRRITKKAIDNSATKLCPEGTIAIVSRVGVGKVAIIPESLCTSQDFTNITSITGNTHYMAYQIAFRMKLEAMKTQGTSIKGVTADTIKSMGVDIPPLEEQKKIADMLTAFDSYIKRAVYELDIFLTMKKALLQQLFI